MKKLVVGTPFGLRPPNIGASATLMQSIVSHRQRLLVHSDPHVFIGWPSQRYQPPK